MDLSRQLIHLIGNIIHVPELLLDSLHLLVEIVLALILLHLLLDATPDALFHFEHVDFTFHQCHQSLKALDDFRKLQDRLLILDLDRHMGSDRIRKTAWIIDARE